MAPSARLLVFVFVRVRVRDHRHSLVSIATSRTNKAFASFAVACSASPEVKGALANIEPLVVQHTVDVAQWGGSLADHAHAHGHAHEHEHEHAHEGSLVG